MSYLQFDEMKVQLIIHTAVLSSSLAITSSSTTGRLVKPNQLKLRRQCAHYIASV